MSLRLLPAIWIVVTFAAAWSFVATVDLSPKVDASFFFSGSGGPAEEDERISEMFPSHDQLVISAEGDIRSAAYQERVEDLGRDLAAVEGVRSVKSLRRGPDDLEDALESPLWRRLLIGPREESSLLLLFLSGDDPGKIVREVEGVVEAHDEKGALLHVSGMPYVAERIRRSLVSDFKVFATSAIVAFALLILAIFRSPKIALGAVTAGLLAVVGTLSLQVAVGIPVGLLTANLVIIVFVLAQSHCIFLSGNATSRGGPRSAEDRVAWAVRETAPASFWSMLTTVLGFASLLLVDAEPLRRLGMAGSVGAGVAFVVAYLVHPTFLAWAGSGPERRERRLGVLSWIERRAGWVAGAFAVVALLPALGLASMRLDPTLLEYFAEDGPVREGLEYIDERGGSSLLKVVVSDPEGRSLDEGDVYDRMWELHEGLTSLDPVGVAVSLPVLMAEGDRHPLSFLVSWTAMLELMRTPEYERVARGFVTEDHTKALFILRTQEGNRQEPRLELLAELRKRVHAAGFVPVLVGGIFVLQAHLADQVASSLIQGVALLAVLFAAVSVLASRSLVVAVAMTAVLLLVANGVLGSLGLLRVPIDIISAPAVNVTMGIAVDAMIHLAMAARRAGGVRSAKAWSAARREQLVAVLTSTTVIAVGFSLFSLSSFPPTQRFGLTIAGGTLLAAAAALLLLPVLTSVGGGPQSSGGQREA